MVDFKNKKAVVIGLGISNVPLINYLLEHGASVSARDRSEFEKLSDEAKKVSAKCGEVICGDGYLEDLDGDVVFRTPSLRPDDPHLLDAERRGIEITSEMELFFELCPGKIVGITGSDGKTTSTTLTYMALSAKFGSENVWVGGNIGAPLLPQVEKMNASSWAVVELSNFQLISMKRSPDYSLITNIAPNHLDFHRDMDEYIESKTHIFRYQKPGSRVVLNSKNEITRGLAPLVPETSELLYFLGSGTVESDGEIFREGRPFLSTGDILLPGRHNVENYMGVIALVGDIAGSEIITEIARTFKGVRHRIQLIREKDGIKYYNSSIDSSPTRTAACLRSFGEKPIVICGGYDKHIPFGPLADVLCEKAKRVVLTGATMGAIRRALDEKDGEKPEILEVPDFTEAVLTACRSAERGDTVVLSPGCASFDAFRNFEERGDRFIEIIEGL
ncbi:MAG: UDP-N-acetylmuramoyl-L-alanine--D-glutamate ligase [Clostridia bacterium]|nr:UDP-N-acetylmuramoyl-L-alanine--D-glutamate ligase [Clostridia bacterium]